MAMGLPRKISLFGWRGIERMGGVWFNEPCLNVF